MSRDVLLPKHIDVCLSFFEQTLLLVIQSVSLLMDQPVCGDKDENRVEIFDFSTVPFFFQTFTAIGGITACPT